MLKCNFAHVMNLTSLATRDTINNREITVNVQIVSHANVCMIVTSCHIIIMVPIHRASYIA